MASTYSNLKIHVIFAVKNRRPLIQSPAECHRYIAGIARNQGCEVIAVGGVADHVHMLFALKPTDCLADVIREVKKSSSSWMKRTVPEFSWQDGYSAFAVGQNGVAAVKAYIANQEEHHRHIDSSEELLKFLAEEGVIVDMRYYE
jgi:putative transposase